MDNGVQFITLVGPRQSSLARHPDCFLCLPFIPSVYVTKPTFPTFSSLLWKMLEGDTIKLVMFHILKVS